MISDFDNRESCARVVVIRQQKKQRVRQSCLIAMKNGFAPSPGVVVKLRRNVFQTACSQSVDN
jgi:hypothetical protein